MAYRDMAAFQWSHSSRMGAKKCWKKGHFTKLYNHRRRDASIAAEAGKAIHAAFQEWMVSKDMDKAIVRLMLEYPVELEHTDQHGNHTLESAYATLNALMHQYKFSEWELAYIRCGDGVERPAIELPFRIRLSGVTVELNGKHIPVEYIGYIDLVLRHRVTGEFKVVDIKTTRRMMKDPTAQYMYDEQCVPYAIVIEHALGHKITTFAVEYLMAFVDLTEPKVQSLPFQKSQQDIMAWGMSLMCDVQQLQQFMRWKWFPRNASACVNFNRVCQYFELCAVDDPDIIQKMLLVDENAEVQKDDFEPWIDVELDFQGADA